MPFTIVRNDIVRMAVDAVVNTANPLPVIGLGTDSRIHQAAGPALLEARQAIGPLCVGDAAITPGFLLPAKYVIHTAGPVWQGGRHGEVQQLERCYESALRLALEYRCGSLAFPLISSGNYGFPKDLALQVAVSVCRRFLQEQEMDITLVVYDRESFLLSEQLFRDVASYIDENYITAYHAPQPSGRGLPRRKPRRDTKVCSVAEDLEDRIFCPSEAAPADSSLDTWLKQADAGFSETLLRLIDASGKTDPEIYKKANLSRQHFSKIRNNPHYQPKKHTAIALALALELDLEATEDLIRRAGYALSSSSQFDLIIRYFITQKTYDVMTINMVLFDRDQPLLGA